MKWFNICALVLAITVVLSCVQAAPRPDTADTPDTPDTPDTSDTPDTPDTSDTPETSDIPEALSNIIEELKAVKTVQTAGKIVGGIATGVLKTVETAGKIAGGIGNGVINTIGGAGKLAGNVAKEGTKIAGNVAKEGAKIAGNTVKTGLNAVGNAAKAEGKKVLMEVKQEVLQELVDCLNNTATVEDSVQASGETDCKIIYTLKSDENEAQTDSPIESSEKDSA